MEMIKKVLCHEIVHAVMYSYHVDLSHREEEMVADLISSYGDEIMRLTHLTYDKLKFM